MKAPERDGRYANTVAQTMSAPIPTFLRGAALGVAAAMGDAFNAGKHEQTLLGAAIA
jgi:hypothetical protein